MLDLNKGMFEFVNAGHLVPLITNAGDTVTTYTDADLVIGVLPDFPYRVQRIELQGVKAICLYSDGVTEAINEREEMYGDDRLLEAYSATAKASSKEWVEAMMAQVTAFRGKQPPSDDITILIARLS
jgi:serine phosphatase RsbU (regulator of sigma subunit)